MKHFLVTINNGYNEEDLEIEMVKKALIDCDNILIYKSNIDVKEL